MSKKKLVFSILIFIIVIGITFYAVFSNTSPKQMINNLEEIKISYTLICLGLVVLYFVLQSLCNILIFHSLKQKVPFIKAFYYSIVEFFFSAITLSSTGGQPAELFYMTKDKIPVRKSLIVLTLNTIYFKLFLIIAGILILIFKHDFVFGHGTLFTVLFFLGLLIDLLFSLALYLVIFQERLANKFIKLYYKLREKFLKKNDTNSKLEETINNYKKEMDYISSHHGEVMVGLLITCLQRITLFSIAYVIYRAFGFNTYHYQDLLIIQIGVQIAIEGLPLPGGTGASEHLYNTLFVTIFGSALASTGMFLVRMYSFYIPILVILIIVCVVTKFYYFKRKKVGK